MSQYKKQLPFFFTLLKQKLCRNCIDEVVTVIITSHASRQIFYPSKFIPKKHPGRYFIHIIIFSF